MNGQKIEWENVFADFQRYINEAKAEAWDEGFADGWDRGHYESGNETNPYRNVKDN